jgi:CRISPR/Cas system-associated exonuclease Cas4 (RecB family)
LKWKLQPPPTDLTEDLDTDTIAGERVPLEQGTHFEVELRHPGIKWRGFADLIELRDDLCTIEDFKSGEPSDDHLLQLQIYALLWSHDEELNPAKTAADKLVICYPNGNRIVPFDKKSGSKLAQELQARTKAVRKTVSGSESQANLDAERCPQCDIRHLRSDYWTENRPVVLTAKTERDFRSMTYNLFCDPARDRPHGQQNANCRTMCPSEAQYCCGGCQRTFWCLTSCYRIRKSA